MNPLDKVTAVASSFFNVENTKKEQVILKIKLD
jgi:hypothetical protein